ncbi:MAG: DMT family transporter [bacterium]|nr:DMT family transporter [bacterium]MBU1917414.1 DMT family transporter [bacterium]
MQPIHILYFILTTLFWGGSFLAIKIVIHDITPGFAAFLRCALCLVFLIPYFLLKTKNDRKKGRLLNLPRKRILISSFVSGFFAMGLSWICLFWGEQHVTPALAAVINSSCPIYVTMFAFVITPADKYSLYKWVGVLLGFLGVLVIFWPELFHTNFSQYTYGLFAILVTTTSYAIGILWTRRLMPHIPNLIHMILQTSGAAFTLIVFSLITKSFFITTPSVKVWLALFYLGLCSTTFAGLMFIRLIKEVGSVQASVITLCMPIIAIILDMIFLDAYLTVYQVMGTVLILMAIIAINGEKKIRETIKKLRA